MSDLHDGNELSEFEYTDEEKAELAALEALNGDSDELKAEPSNEDEAAAVAAAKVDPEIDPEIELDDDFVDHLLTADPEKAVAPAPVEEVPVVDVDVEEEPAPDYSEQIEESTQRLQAAQGEIDDTLQKLTELAEQYDDGEIAQGKYDVERLKLERELRRHETAFDSLEQQHAQLSEEANTKVGEYQDTRRTAWRNDLIGFLEDPANEVIANNQHIAEQFDSLLNSMGQSGVFEGLNNAQILQSVRNQLSFRVPELSKATYAPKAAAKAKPVPPKPTQKPNIPASLSQMTAQEMPADDPFAYIRKLSGIQYEEALSKLSESQQEAFFFG